MTSPTEYKITARVAATGAPAVVDTGTTNLDIDTTWGGKPGLPELRGRSRDTPPKFVEITYTLRITTDEPQRRVDLVHRNLRQYGTIYNTLAVVCEVHGELVAVPSAQSSTGI